jgi:hypothetical protein
MEKNLQTSCLLNLRNLVICENELILQPSDAFEKCLDENFNKKIFVKDEEEFHSKLSKCRGE